MSFVLPFLPQTGNLRDGGGSIATGIDGTDLLPPTLTVTDCLFSRGSSIWGWGGAVQAASMVISRCQFDENAAMVCLHQSRTPATPQGKTSRHMNDPSCASSHMFRILPRARRTGVP